MSLAEAPDQAWVEQVPLGSLRWPDVAAGRRCALVAVALGSCEQHGPHLPLRTDTVIAEAVVAGIAELPRLGAVAAEPLGYGASGEHEGFPGTISIGLPALELVVIEIGHSASRFAERVLFVSGHGGNHEALVAAVRRLRGEGRDAAWWLCAPGGGDAHAGRSETSLMLALRPDLVRLERAEAGNTAPLASLMPLLRRDGVAAASPNGVLGDPAGASAEEGMRLFAALSASLAAAVLGWSVGADGALAPR